MAPWVCSDLGTQGSWYVYGGTASTSVRVASVYSATNAAFTYTNYSSTTCNSHSSNLPTWVEGYDRRLEDRIPALRRQRERTLTPEEVALRDTARVRQERELRAQSALRRALRQSAEAKAEALLLHHLDAAQQKQYTLWGWFEVSLEGRLYRISNRSITRNVTLRHRVTHEIERTYCAHPCEDLPIQDVMLAQMLALKTNEEEFLRIANAS